MHKKQKIVFFVCLVFFIAIASAHSIDRHLIQVEIAENGTAKITEKYFLLFQNSIELSSFRIKAIENGSDLGLWSIFDGNITTSIGKVKAGTGRVIFEDKQNEKIVTIEYKTDEEFMKKKSEGSRKIEWEINPNIMSAFDSGSVYFIPGNVDISVLLPKNSQLSAENIVPTAVVSGNIVSWSGPISVSGNFVLDYATEKQIAPTVSISKVLQDFAASDSMAPFATVIAILLAFSYWKRKTITKKIEAYIIAHSKLESKQGKEEEELE